MFRKIIRYFELRNLQGFEFNENIYHFLVSQWLKLSATLLGKRFWTFSRKIKTSAEFDPSALADFRVTEWDPTPLMMELYRTPNSHFHRHRLRKEGSLDTLNLGQTRPGLFRRYKTKYLHVSDSTLTCFQTQPSGVSATPKLSVSLFIIRFSTQLCWQRRSL